MLGDTSPREGDRGGMKLEIGLNESLHTECNLFLCPSPEHWAARCRWNKHLNTLEKGAMGTDI